ncbi:hypothetical protein [Zhongshania sp.]|uniref:hypothetical protein n=1 Tax=Zhongshania sp. TaxID=1971902 RepID=UPI0035683DA7
MSLRKPIPGLKEDSYSEAAATLCHEFIEADTGASLKHTGIAFMDLTPAGDLYYSVTRPSIICASYGGGTGLPTQRECLEMMHCYGQCKTRKLAEIIGATVLAGDLSLTAAIVSDEWVSSHDQLGRNRP